MNLVEILNRAGKTEADITKIYHGKDNWCRCGCGGRYFYKNEAEDTRGFKRAINAMLKPDFHCFDVEYASNYINIPTSDATSAGTCYCIYFN